MKTARLYTAGDVELRLEGEAEKGITGYAALYDSLSVDMGFRERIAPGAFALLLKSNPDVRGLFNHDDDKVLGRTASGTMTLMNTSRGLRFTIPELPDTSYARDLRAMIKRGDVSGCSFAFGRVQDSWGEEVIDGQKSLVRTIHEIGRLYDVGPVAFPAYPETEVSMRAEARDSFENWQRINGYPLDLAWLDLLEVTK